MYEEGTKLWKTKGEEHQKAKKHFIENMKFLENELGKKHYFREDFGFLDIALETYPPWFHTKGDPQADGLDRGMQGKRDCLQGPS